MNQIESLKKTEPLTIAPWVEKTLSKKSGFRQENAEAFFYVPTVGVTPQNRACYWPSLGDKMNKPLIVKLALSRLTRLVDDMRYGRHSPRAMRTERINGILVVLGALIRLCCLQFGGTACAVRDGYARPITVPELAKMTALPQRTVERCLRDIKSMDYIDVGKQHVSAWHNGSPIFVVSSVMRTFTPKFWALLGLSDLFKQSVQYAREKGKQVLNFVIPTYQKFKKTVNKSLTTLTSLLDSPQQQKKLPLDDVAFLNCPARKLPKCPHPCSRASECIR